jgi:uncharacterized membrane protein
VEKFYLVLVDGAQRGPYSVDQLKNFRGNGEIPAGSLVWTEGMSDWQPLETIVPGVVAVTPTPPPPMAMQPRMSAPGMPTANGSSGADSESNYTFFLIVHILMAAGLVTGVTPIAAVIMAYIRKDEVRGTYFESHAKWIIETFWWSVALGVIGFITLFIFIGVFVLIGAFIWYLYRIIMGIVRISERKPIGA